MTKPIQDAAGTDSHEGRETTGAALEPGSAEEFAKQWLLDHAPEPLKCANCGEAQSFAPMAHGMAAFPCPKSPIKGMGHVYNITIGGPDLTYVSHAACAEAYASKLRAEVERLKMELKQVKR